MKRIIAGYKDRKSARRQKVNKNGSSTPRESIKYPETKRDIDVIDNYFGTRIADPYRWLECANSDKVKNFVRVQNEFTDQYLQCHEISGGDTGELQARDRMKARLVDLWMHCDYDCPFKRGDRYFYFKNGALYAFQSKSLEHIAMDGDDDEEEKVFDPHQDISNEGDSEGHFHLSSATTKEKTDENIGDPLVSISEDGKILAYGVSLHGSVWTTIHFRNLRSGQEYEEEELGNVRQDTYFAWMKDGSGLFYRRYQKSGLNFHQEGIYFHRMGTLQKEDKLVIKFTRDPEWELKPRVSVCGLYLIIFVLERLKGQTKLYVGKMEKVMANCLESDKLAPLIQLGKIFKADYNYVTNVGSEFYFLTNQDAPNGKVVRVKVINKKAKMSWNCIVPENRKNVLTWVLCVNEIYLVCCYIRNACSVLQLRSRHDGSLICKFNLDMGTVTGYSGRFHDTQFFFKFTSFLIPSQIYRVNLERKEIRLHVRDFHFRNWCSCCCCKKATTFELPYRAFKQSLPRGFDPQIFETSQVFYSVGSTSKVSMFLVHKKNLVRNGMNPCILVGYGGFNSSLQPDFDPTYLLFVENFDGVYAIANIRGGATSGVHREYGKTWYESGIRQHKQRTFDDFQAAAKYLIRTKYTCSRLLTVSGDSNGGLVVAACVNQKPELFGAAIIRFGVLDLLRFHKYTSGSSWISDYGSPDQKKDCKNLVQISPVHNVKLPEDQDVQYPAVLLITGDNDEIVLPFHSYKMIAQLQSKIGSSPKQKNCLLIRVEKNAGHGEGMRFDAVIEEITDILTFIKKSLDLTFKE